MKLKQLKCPSCGAGIEMDLKGRDTVFCPYCGNQFSIDDGSINVTYTYNYNEHKRFTDDAAVERERRKDRANERDHKEMQWLMLIAVFCIVLALAIPFISEINNKKKTSIGMIQVGQSSDDMEGKDYHAVVAQLESAGFKNITTIDLDDTFIIIRPSDTIESVSIGGKTNFNSTEYFYPDTPIVISYH